MHLFIYVAVPLFVSERILLTGVVILEWITDSWRMKVKFIHNIQGRSTKTFRTVFLLNEKKMVKFSTTSIIS